jgi:DNA polymerase elongation subunit (family B)
MNIVFDIETIPVQDEVIIKKIADEIKAPATMKKAETITNWEQNDKQSAIDEAVAKTSFDGAYGSICCIGWAIDDGEIKSVIGKERFIIQSFFNDILEAGKDAFKYANVTMKPVFIGHNVSAFDLRFLFQRAVVLGIKPPYCIPFNAKSWDSQIYDTMTSFAGFGNRISLDKLSNNTMTGADVYPMYKEGRIDDIAAYCRDDVNLTRSVYKRLSFA